MKFQVNSQVSSAQNLLDLINQVDNAGLTLAQVTLSAPSVATDAPSASDDTQVTLTAIPGSGIFGSRTVFYERLPLAQSVPNPQLIYEVDDSATFDSIFAAIVENLNLIADDVVLTGDVTKPADGTTTSTLTLAPSPTSYAYNGDSLTITLAWEKSLSSIIPVTDLGGFTGEDAST